MRVPERRQSAEDYDAPVTSSMTGSEFRTAAMRAAVVGVPARGGRANTPPRVLAALAASPPPRPRVAMFVGGSCSGLTDLTPAIWPGPAGRTSAARRLGAAGCNSRRCGSCTTGRAGRDVGRL